MKNVIMTGGTGFIGGWLLEELVENSIEVTLLARDKNRVPDDVKGKANVIEYNPEKIDVLSLDDKYDAFYHMGWGGVSPAAKNDIDLQLANISGSVKAMKYAASIGCKRFISAGTVAEYVFCKDVMDFNAKQTPNDIYGASKTATHYLLDVIARQTGIPFNWVVIPSTFGERRTDNNILTYTIRTLLKGEKPQYGNLEQMWDFLYVKEVARALRLVGEKGKPGKTYGIGSGVYKPLKDYIETIRDIIDPNLPLGIGEIPSMSTQTFSSCVSILALTKDTGFVPALSFEDGIKKTIDWVRNEQYNSLYFPIDAK